jgi:hypothetical protein
MCMTDPFLFIRRLKINHEFHWAYAFILEFSTVANTYSTMVCGKVSKVNWEKFFVIISKTLQNG